MSTFQERMKDRRLKLGMTLLDIAESLGVREATVQRYESGEIKNVKHETIYKLSKILKCNPSYLMGWTDNPEPERHQEFHDAIKNNKSNGYKENNTPIPPGKYRYTVIRKGGKGQIHEDIDLDEEDFEIVESILKTIKARHKSNKDKKS